LLIVLADEMKQDSENTFRKVCEFLGIRPVGLQRYPRYNLLPSSAMNPETQNVWWSIFGPTTRRFPPLGYRVGLEPVSRGRRGPALGTVRHPCCTGVPDDA
jgi:hypothetical protein